MKICLEWLELKKLSLFIFQMQLRLGMGVVTLLNRFFGKIFLI